MQVMEEKRYIESSDSAFFFDLIQSHDIKYQLYVADFQFFFKSPVRATILSSGFIYPLPLQSFQLDAKIAQLDANRHFKLNW